MTILISLIKAIRSANYSSLSRTVFPNMPTAASASLLVSSNPVRVAQFSYELITGCISDIIPLAIRIDKNSGDTDAVRALVALFMNRLYQVRTIFYQLNYRGYKRAYASHELGFGIITLGEYSLGVRNPKIDNPN